MEQNLQANQVELDLSTSRSFINKVYLLMGLGLLLTMGSGFYMAEYQLDFIYAIYSSGTLGFIGLLIVQLLIVSVITRQINSSNVSAPMLLSMFAMYSLTTGITVSFYLLVFDAFIIMYAFGMTAITFAITAIIGYTVKKDLSAVARGAMFALIGIIIVSLITMITGTYDDTFMLIMDYALIIIFSILIAKDTQMMKNMALSGNTATNAVVFCALNLYLDFINMFLAFVRIAGND